MAGFYDSKSRYAAEQSSGKTAQGTPATPSGLKEMEIRTPAGSVIRICGELNENELFSIIWACNHVQP